MEVLQAAEIDGDSLRLVGQLDRGLYARVDKLLKGIGVKWSRKDGKHLFTEPETAGMLAEMLAGGEAQKIDKLGYFPTPRALVEHIVDEADIWTNHTVLEPSAGRGAIIDYLLGWVAPENIWAVEIQQKHAEAMVEEEAKRRYQRRRENHTPLLPLWDHLSATERAAAVKLVREESYPNLIVGDFMEASFPHLFDRVVMNPPFERKQDIDHVTRAYELLKPGGSLVAIMSASTLMGGRRKNQDFLKLFEEAEGESERNPEDAFKESGTSVNTITVQLYKPEED
jgi:predicted RNA methylase